MRIYGVDFTSAPSQRKPITVARATLTGTELRVTRVDSITDWHQFHTFLNEAGPWRAGFDFPFSQPARLFADYGMNGKWAALVAQLNAEGRPAFEAKLRTYMDAQPSGDKQHFRQTDRRANSCSPMKLDYTPVGKMFIEGAPRLIAEGLSILPLKESDDPRVAVEAYPKLVAMKYVGRTTYKSETKPKQSEEHRQARDTILAGLTHHGERDYGIEVNVSVDLVRQCVEDGSGDTLDAVLCAIQAAWSYRCQDPPNGVPLDVDLREGWITDPGLLER